MAKSKQAKAREFSAKAREEIKKRDGGCIFCKMGYHMAAEAGYLHSVMHYIPRSQNGLGIPENGAIGCQYHHTMMDNGNEGLREEMLEIFREYLKQQYPGWDESKLTYSKWSFLEGGIK